MIPIPKTQHELLDGPKSNASLYFARMTECEENGKIAQNAIVKLGERLNSRFPTVNTPLAAIHARQAGFLGTVAQHAERADSGLALEIRARLTAPFVSGLGSGHPTETGLILDRNSGLPYIPASSIKGVLRLACALHIAETDPAYKDKEALKEIPDDHPLLRRYFGDTDADKADGVRGQLVFLDAFPGEVSANLLKSDIMNPHFGKYYAGEQGPLETDNPVPVKFLAVASETEFVFRCFASPLPEHKPDDKDAAVFRPFGKTDEETVVTLFKRAFEQLGFGGKTAIGYGRFAEQSIKRGSEVIPPPPPKPWDSWLNELKQVEDWGRLYDLVFNNPNAETWRGEEGVALAVQAACSRVQATFPKKWREKQEERDGRCREWLEPVGISWPQGGGAPKPPDKPKQPGGEEPPEVSELEQRIRELKDYGHYKSQNIALASLTLPEALTLQGRFKDWKCNDKRARGDKKDHWQNLQARIRELKH